jgi:hypothetical protein
LLMQAMVTGPPWPACAPCMVFIEIPPVFKGIVASGERDGVASQTNSFGPGSSGQ